MGRVLKLAGATAPAGPGLVSASGGVSGTIEQLSLRELTFNGMGQSLRASGTLALPGAAQGALQVGRLQGQPPLNGQTLDGAIDVALTGAKPNIVADLKAATLDPRPDRRCTGTARPAAGRGSRQPPGPIDTGPLRSVDGSFKLHVGTLVNPPLRIANVDLAALPSRMAF